MTRIVFVAVLCTLCVKPALSEHRAALLIGNATYEKHALPTPYADVQAVATALTRRGFRTTVVLDVDAERLGEALERFAQSVPTRGTALVYYSGYAMQGERNGKRTNFLLPVDASVRNLKILEKSRYSIMDLLELLHAKSGAGRQIVLVDGAYEHPDRPRDVPLGLSRPDELVQNSLLGFAAPPGQLIERRGTLSLMASTLTQRLNESTGLREAVETASGWSATTFDPGLELAARASVAIASPTLLRPGTKVGDEWVNAGGMVFCWCPPGKHTRGFWLAKFELTRRESGLSSQRTLASDKNHPIDMIHPREIAAYLKALNASETEAGRLPTDWKYSLPTEVEWEYACRAGTSTRFHFGEDRRALPLHANFADESLLGWSYTDNALNDKTPQLARVGEYRANPWGIHDMYGNLWEWVEPHGDEWIVRGGSWVSIPDHCSSASRWRLENHRARNFLGYRILLKRKP